MSNTHEQSLQAAVRKAADNMLLPVSTYPAPRKIDDLVAAARRIISRISELQEEELATVTMYPYNLPTRRLVSDVRKEISDLHEQLDLILSEYTHRRI